MNATLEFFTSVLPDAPFLCASQKGKKWIDTPCVSIEQVVENSFLASVSGSDTYFALSGFEQQGVMVGDKVQFRTAQNAVTQKALWLDIDCDKPGKPREYRTYTDGLAALEKFSSQVGLPEPTLVYSGFGLHVYWTMAEQIPTARWKNLATKLKQLTQQLGLMADHSRTTDAASVLRVPGTKNYAVPTEPQGVTILRLSPPTPVAELERILFTAAAKNVAPPSQSAQPAPFTMLGMEEALELGLHPYVKKVLKNECAKVAATQEPGRNNALNKAAFILGGFVGSGGLDEGMARSRLTEAATQCGLPADEITSTITSGLESGKAQPRSIPDRQSKLPEGFEIREGSRPGLWHVESKEDTPPVETWLGPALHIRRQTRNAQSNAWGLLLEWNDPDGKPHRWSMPKALLVGKDSSAWLSRLADEGWSGAPGNNARKLLALYLTTYTTDLRAVCVSRTGWYEGVFVLPDTVIGDKKGEEVVLQTQTAHNPFIQGGTFEGWQSTIGRFCVGNSRLVFSVSASLAAALLEPAGHESSGFNFVGGSSIGKTTALAVGGSVWGSGATSGGYMGSWRATDNGLEGMAVLHSDAALCLDEIGQAPAKTITEAAYMLAGGMTKTRAGRAGEMRASNSWRCMVLSTGEKGLAEKIEEVGGTVHAGQLVRLIDIPADAGAGYGLFENLHGLDSAQAFSDAIKKEAATHYGHLARIFIAQWQSVPDGAKQLRQLMNHYLVQLCPADADGQVRRVAGHFALCALAGTLATKCGFLPWPANEAFRATKICFDAWLVRRGGTGAAEDAAAYQQVRLFLQRYGDSRYQNLQMPDEKCNDRVGFRKRGEDFTTFYTFPEAFEKELCRGHDPERAARVLRDRGILVAPQKRLKTKSPDLPGLGRMQCYTLRIGNENTEDEA